MQKHDIKTIDEITDADKGQWRDCDIDNFHVEYFEDVGVIDKPELDYGIYTVNYFREKFPGLPEEAYEVLASERHRLEVLASERHRLDNILSEIDTEIETTTFTDGENKLIIVE